MADLDQVRDSVGGLLAEIAAQFIGCPKITLIVRHPELEAEGKDADFVLTNDTLDQAIEALQRRAAVLPRNWGASS